MNDTNTQHKDRLFKFIFGNPDHKEWTAEDGDIEVRVRMLNVNYGFSRALMEVCKVLEEYSEIVDGVRKNRRVMRTLGDAVDAVIDDMPDDYILKKFLVAHRAEVKGMYLTEYNAEKEQQRALREGREEGREIGLEEGRAEGREIGLEEGRAEGRAEGREIGLTEGREIGRSEGREIGRSEGRTEGRTEGQHDEKERIVIAMLKEKLPLSLIAKISELSEDAIRTIASRLGITLA